jgi:hypothetical protein
MVRPAGTISHQSNKTAAEQCELEKRAVTCNHAVSTLTLCFHVSSTTARQTIIMLPGKHGNVFAVANAGGFSGAASFKLLPEQSQARWNRQQSSVHCF